jgi:hypothetical protein
MSEEVAEEACLVDVVDDAAALESERAPQAVIAVRTGGTIRLPL